MDNGTYMRLANAIPNRRSVRTYKPDPQPDGLEADIARFIAEIDAPFEHGVKAFPFRAEPGKKLYNNAVNPVGNFAFLSQTDIVSVSKTGFVGELAMLYVVSMGYDACWFGHYKLAEVGRYVPGIAAPERIKESTMGYGYGKVVDAGERVIVCMPYGRKADNSKRFIDSAMISGIMTKRKPLADLCEDPAAAGEIPQTLLPALECARLAPSAGNSQMWKFGFNANYSVITVAKPYGYKHFKWEHPDVDIGMCAAQLWLGLLAQGVTPVVTVTKDADRALWAFSLNA